MTSGIAAGLRSTTGLAAVEALMTRLAGDGRAGAMVNEHLATGGKRLRARLALAALDALGGNREHGIAWAAACELLHNATLVHDDLQDGDQVRRGHPTVWARHGVAQAVNAGDLLLMLPILALEHLWDVEQACWPLARALATHAAAVARGQAAELDLAASGDIGWERYRDAVAGKTSALFELPVEGAALLAGRNGDEARMAAEGFGHLGVVFQLQDDLLDLYGNKGRERPGSDLREGKISALVVEHLRLHPEEGSGLRGLLALPRDQTPDAGVEDFIGRFQDGGAVAAVLRRIDAEAESAMRCEGLRRESDLCDLARELVSVALAPIAHLRSVT